MKLNVKDIQPLSGIMSCYLWENSTIKLPLALYYSIEIPLKAFNSGHEYVDQPTETSIILEWIKFIDNNNGKQETNWRKLAGRQFDLSYEKNTAEGSIYLGTEHCLVDSQINFLSLSKTTFDVELRMKINFNIETSNRDDDGLLKIKTQLDYDGLRIYHTQLPSFQNAGNQLALIEKYIDLEVYEYELRQFDNETVDWKHLKPK